MNPRPRRAWDRDEKSEAADPAEAFLTLLAVDRHGYPASRATVIIKTPGHVGRTKTKTGENGQLRIATVKGPVDLEVIHSDHGPTQIRAEVPGTIRIPLYAGALIGGQVRNAKGIGIPEAAISVRQNGRTLSLLNCRSNAEGNFFIPAAPRQELTLCATHPAHVASCARVTPPVESVALTLERPAMLSGMVRQSDGAPAAHADVIVVGSGIWPPRRIKSIDGHFEFPQVPAGVYELYAQRGIEISQVLAGVQVPYEGDGILELRLERGVTLSGWVRDPTTDDPIENARITATPRGLGGVPRAARTRSDGAFSLAGLPSSSLRFQVEAAGRISVLAAWSPGQPRPTVYLTRSAAVRGRVIDTRGFPIVDASIYVRHLDNTAVVLADAFVNQGATAEGFPSNLRQLQEGHPTWLNPANLGVVAQNTPPITDSIQSRGTDARSTSSHKTDDAGIFMIEDLPAGSVQLEVYHPDYAVTRSNAISLESGQMYEPVELRMPRAGHIVGRIKDARGYPLPQAPIHWQALDNRTPSALAAKEDGTFGIDGIVGKIWITAMPFSSSAARVSVVVEAGVSHEIELIVPDSSSVSYGRILDIHGYPIEGASIRVSAEGRPYIPTKTLRSGSDGTFESSNLPEPPWVFRVNHPSFAVTELTWDRGEEPFEVRLERAKTLIGSVANAWTQTPISNATLRILKGKTLLRSTESDEGGRFYFSRLSIGEFTLEVQHDSFLGEQRPVRLSSNDLESKEIEPIYLSPAGRIRGTVTDRNGQRVSDATVIVEGIPPVKSNVRGDFRLLRIRQGTHRVFAIHDALGATLSETVQVHADEEVRIDLAFRAYADSAAGHTESIHYGVPFKLGYRNGTIVVTEIAPGSSAQAQGIRPGTEIAYIDGWEVTDLEMAIEALEGPPGQAVEIFFLIEDALVRRLIPREALTSFPRTPLDFSATENP
ncbi:MAG: carboxypeptidase regulatory-like domain-containing protein [Myxococcota bacterium]